MIVNDWIVGVAAFHLIAFAIALIGARLLPRDEWETTSVEIPGPYWVWGAPLLEEVCFRGPVVLAIRLSDSPAIVTIVVVVTSGLFLLLHRYSSPWAVMYRTLCTVGWTGAALTTASVIPPIVLHWFNNVLGFLLTVYARTVYDRHRAVLTKSQPSDKVKP